MSGPPAVPDKSNLRASDSDRERVADIVRQAAGDGRLNMEELDERLDAVYAAKTYAELEPITKDLPASGASHAPVPAQPPAGASAVNRIGGQPTAHNAVAVLGGHVCKGDWVVPKDFNAVAILGGVELDFRQARFAERVVTVHAVAIMGGIEITVPDDVTVHISGIGIMGGFDHGASGDGAPGGPEIVINGVAIMGGVEIRRKPLEKAKRERLEPKQAGELEN